MPKGRPALLDRSARDRRHPSGVLGAFSRRTSSGAFIPLVDGLRFVAISMVVLYHETNFSLDRRPSGNWFVTDVLEQGAFGVHLFFVISGFILALPFAMARAPGTRPISLRRYYLRRLTRLEPPYMLSLLAMFVALAILRHIDPVTELEQLGAGLAYSYSAVYGQYDTINPVAWSLEIEVQFYLLVPLLALVFVVRSTLMRRAAIVGLAFGAVALERFVLAPVSPRFELSLFAYAQFFLIGFLLADIYNSTWRGLPSPHWLWDGLWLAAFPALSIALRGALWWDWLIPVLVLALFLGFFRGAAARRFLSHPIIFTVGGMCYSIYLLHLTLIKGLHRVLGGVHVGSSFVASWLLQVAMVSPLVLCISAAYFLAVERPCMDPRWPQRLKGMISARVSR